MPQRRLDGDDPRIRLSELGSQPAMLLFPSEGIVEALAQLLIGVVSCAREQRMQDLVLPLVVLPQQRGVLLEQLAHKANQQV